MAKCPICFCESMGVCDPCVLLGMARQTEGWNHGYNLFQRIFREINPRTATVVEVGAWKGAGTLELLSFQPKKLYSIDTWEGSPEHSEDRHVIEGTLFQEYLSNLGNFVNKVNVLRTTSIRAADIFNWPELDLVYIDANHEELLQDINAWWPKIKKGGYIAGDDYSNTWPKVKEDVDSFARDREVILEGVAWAIKKD